MSWHVAFTRGPKLSPTAEAPQQLAGSSAHSQGLASRVRCAFDTLECCAGESRPQQQRWLVSVVCAGGASRDMALKWPALHLDPTAGVAVHLRQDRPVTVQACSGER